MDLDEQVIAIVAVVLDWRKKVGAAKPPYSTRALMRACFPDVLVTGAALPKNVFELVQVHGSERTVFYKRFIPTGTQRVAIAHAAAHLVFDAANSECATPTWSRRGVAIPTSPDLRERRADLVAAEYLAPLDEIDKLLPEELAPTDENDRQHLDDEIDHVASRFHVPQKFLIWRLPDLENYRRLRRK